MTQTADNTNIPAEAISPILTEFALSNRAYAVAIMYGPHIAEVNEPLVQLLGYPRECLIGRTYDEFMSSASAEIATDRMDRRIAGEPPGEPQVYEVTDGSGKTRLLETLGLPWPADPMIAVVLVRDVTSRENAIDALKESEKLYRALAESLPVGIVLSDASGMPVYVNGHLAEMTGYSVEEIQAPIWFVHPDDQEASELCMRAFLQGAPCPGHETRIVTKSGQERWVSILFAPIRGESGSLEGVTTVFFDNTDRKQAEDRYRLLAENASDIIWQMDLTGRFTYVSPAVRELGYEPDEWLGRRPADLLAPDEVEAFEQRLASDLQSPGPKLYEVRAMTKSGGQVWLEVRVDFIVDNGRPVMLQGIARNVTERRAADEALRNAHENLQRAYNLQREFLNNVTHEVRTPLTAVQGYARMLLEGLAGSLTHEQAALLKKALAGTESLLEIVNGVLEVTRIKSGRMEVNARVAKPGHIVRKAVAAVAPQAEQKGIEIHVALPPEECVGLYDEQKLTIILTNLLSNAVKFTDKGVVQVLMDCGLWGAEFVVADTGAGIDAKNILGIFQEFAQIRGPRKYKPQGFGIGLAIVASMIELIGATLAVSSVRDVGTAFTLHVPVLKAS